MVTNQEFPGGEEQQNTDEGWWNSILAEEQISDAGNSTGFIESNSSKAIYSQKKDLIKEALQNDEILQVEGFGFNRGGILVQKDSCQGFVPISHLLQINNEEDESTLHKALAGYVGKSIDVKVIEYVPEEKRIVFSERAAMTGSGKRNQLLKSLIAGDVVSGRVTNITAFGVFVDLGGVEGLIHLSELSWGRVQNPDSVLKIGDTAKVIIISVNQENSRIALSLKRLQPNPWESLNQTIQPGDILPAKITCLTRFGAFACLNDIGVEGLIHISSLNLPAGSPLENTVHIGQEIKARILHIDSERRRLGLTLVSNDETEV